MAERIEPAWIAVDWGTTNMRAWAMSEADGVLAQAASPRGMGSLVPDAFEKALLDTVAPWLVEGRALPVIACGMVGARQGWIEAAYSATPTAPVTGTMTPAPTRHKGIRVSIISGVCQSNPADVMRGEETQIAGYVATRARDGLVCLPGTHSKWVALREGAIAWFHTEMTGELFAVLSQHSVLRHSLTSDGWDDAAFDAGVNDALQSGSPLSQLFGVRAASLLGGLPPDAARARLSGLLIGGEITSRSAYFGGDPIALIGAGRLSALYARAIALAGGQSLILDSDEMTLAGLVSAYRSLEPTF